MYEPRVPIQTDYKYISPYILSKKLSTIRWQKFLGHQYIPKYEKDYFDLPWYERDLMSYIDHLKYKEMPKEVQNSDLHRHHWAVHRPLCQDIETPDSCFFHAALITFQFWRKNVIKFSSQQIQRKMYYDKKIVTGLKKRWFFGLRLLPSVTYGRWKGKEDFLQIYTINMDFHLICILNHEWKQKLFQLKKIISELIFLCLRKERLIDFFYVLI